MQEKSEHGHEEDQTRGSYKSSAVMMHLLNYWRNQYANTVTVDDHPEGYPQLAAFINSDENFLMCRRFGFLHSRVLLYRQDELSEMERELIDMDDADKHEDPLMLRSRKKDYADDQPFSRRSLIQTIDEKLKAYGIFLRSIHEDTFLTRVIR